MNQLEATTLLQTVARGANIQCPDLEAFLSLSTAEIAQNTRDAGTQVCVCPIDGTRRWFLMEYGERSAESYLDIMMQCLIDISTLMVDHGLVTLLLPTLGLDQLKRGPQYWQLSMQGLERIASHPILLNFYQEIGAKVSFYGDYRHYLAETGETRVLDLMEQVTMQTQANSRCRFFFGICADDATETAAHLAVEYFAEHGEVPNKRQLVEMYYGEYVEPVNLYIGYDAFCAFDMPLVATGTEDLYFTVNPTPYLTKQQLRTILYDHLYSRRRWHSCEAATTAPDTSMVLNRLKAFCHANQDRTLGVGSIVDGIWYPCPEVVWPNGFARWG